MQNTQEERSSDHDGQRTEQQQRRNPRLVFNDPDRFFNDLLMEQREQA